MKILLTGSSGMLGSEVYAELKRKKHEIIEYDYTKGKDILNEKQLEESMKSASAVIHLAGLIDGTKEDLRKINIEGTRRVVNTAKKLKVKKFVFMSSTGVYGFTNGKVNEKSKINPENEYEKSKAEGEKIVLESGLDACIVRGAIILGANNYWKKMFEMLKKKLPLPCSGTNKFQIIYSKELARAIVLVLKKGKKGEIYLAAGNEKPTLNEFCEMAQEELKLEKRVKHIPAKVAILAGKIFGIKVLTNENIRHLSKERDYDTRKIQKLGWKEKKKIRQALRETIKELK